LKPGPASSKKANHFVDSSLYVPAAVHVQEETVFVDVGAVNDSGQKRQHVDNNNKSRKIKNPFFVREKHWDDDDDVVIIL
jgi:hypothetical protein